MEDGRATPPRIVVLGNSGSGKTTLAAAVADRLEVRHVELDALFHEPGWTPAEEAVFRERVARATADGGWVVDGNYHATRDLVWPCATTVVWLDLPLRTAMRRLLGRSLHRAVTKRPLYNDNRELFRKWLEPDHPIWWTLRQHRLRRVEYAAAMDHRWVRLRSDVEVRTWLRQLEP